jgi:hypothetical protein
VKIVKEVKEGTFKNIQYLPQCLNDDERLFPEVWPGLLKILQKLRPHENTRVAKIKIDPVLVWVLESMVGALEALRSPRMINTTITLIMTEGWDFITPWLDVGIHYAMKGEVVDRDTYASENTSAPSEIFFATTSILLYLSSKIQSQPALFNVLFATPNYAYYAVKT